VIRIVVVVFVDYWVNHDRLFVNCEDGISGDGNPRF